MSNRICTLAVLAVLALFSADCSRGGRSREWNEQTIATNQPPPGSGQTGPGDTARVNQINGPNDSTY
jgi:hypothetical protein